MAELDDLKAGLMRLQATVDAVKAHLGSTVHAADLVPLVAQVNAMADELGAASALPAEPPAPTAVPTAEPVAEPVVAEPAAGG